MGKRKLYAFFILVAVICCIPQEAEARVTTLQNGVVFDSDFYATLYPDVMAAYGLDADKLLNHYLVYGVKEGRIPSMVISVANNNTVNVLPQETATLVIPQTITIPALIPSNQLFNRKSIKKSCSDLEFQAAYNAAAGITTPLLGKSKPEQLQAIQGSLRAMVDSGQVVYATSVPHYNDPYGYFCLGVASCAGCARATGLCLNILGIPYEHVNENQWSHQWCRVNVDGTYWICDPYGMYVGPEPAPYCHPYLW